MEKHLLLTISDDASSMHGVRFVCSFFKNKANIKLTLLYVASTFESSETKRESPPRKVDKGIADAGRDKGRLTMEECRKLLILRGYKEDSINTKLINKRFGTVKDIVIEARAGLYDAAVLGRRGFAVFEKALSSSVSREILEQRIDFPIWICKRSEEERKNVLLCVDETSPSQRIADHIGFMLQDEDHRITLFHVDDGEGQNTDLILSEARQTLLDHNIAKERITDLVVRTPRVAAAILEEAEKGAYAVVAVGRGGGQPKGMFKQWLVGGSRSMKLLDTLEKAALWVSK